MLELKKVVLGTKRRRRGSLCERTISAAIAKSSYRTALARSGTAP